jgi:hypothetical protein
MLVKLVIANLLICEDTGTNKWMQAISAIPPFLILKLDLEVMEGPPMVASQTDPLPITLIPLALGGKTLCIALTGMFRKAKLPSFAVVDLLIIIVTLRAHFRVSLSSITATSSMILNALGSVLKVPRMQAATAAWEAR